MSVNAASIYWTHLASPEQLPFSLSPCCRLAVALLSPCCRISSPLRRSRLSHTHLASPRTPEPMDTRPNGHPNKRMLSPVGRLTLIHSSPHMVDNSARSSFRPPEPLIRPAPQKADQSDSRPLA